MFTKITEERAFDGILVQIIENIRRGELKPGDTLPAERVMAESLGVSRPAVREVLRALELMGIVTTVRGGANYITENMDQWLSAPLALLFQLNNSHVQQVQELRSALEQEAALLAAGKCTEKDALDLRSILAQLESSEDEKARAGLDKELHTKIGRIAGNPMIYNVLDAAAQLTEEIISGTRAYIMQKHNSALEVDDQHRRLVEAIISGDRNQAEKLMREHMETIEKYILEIAQQQGENSLVFHR